MEQQIDLKAISLIELKALAYDFIATKEQTDRNLAAVNNEITIRHEQAQKIMQVTKPENTPDPGLTNVVDVNKDKTNNLCLQS